MGLYIIIFTLICTDTADYQDNVSHRSLKETVHLKIQKLSLSTHSVPKLNAATLWNTKRNTQKSIIKLNCFVSQNKKLYRFGMAWRWRVNFHFWLNYPLFGEGKRFLGSDSWFWNWDWSILKIITKLDFGKELTVPYLVLGGIKDRHSHL